MASKNLQARCPSNLQTAVDEYQEENNLDHKSEATRQLIERGVRDWRSNEPRGLWLVRQSTGISAMSSLMAGVLVFTSIPQLASGFVGLLAVTIVFASLWAAMLFLEK